MLTSFFIMLISVVLKITVGELSKTYSFLSGWVVYFNIAMWAMIFIFVIFVIISLVKELLK